MRNRTTDDDLPAMRLDIETLAVAEPTGLHDLAGGPNGQVFPHLPMVTCGTVSSN